MNTRSIASSLGLATVLATFALSFALVGSVSAQAIGTAGANLGTVTIPGNAQGTAAVSIPVTITSIGGSVSNLSNCHFVNASNVVVTNPLGSIATGANTFTFTGNGLFAGGSVGAVTLTLRCDIAANTPSGATFTAVAGSPTYVGSASATLSVNIDTAPSVPAGSTNVALANISVGANSTNTVTISSIPVSVLPSSGASLGNLVNCRIRNTNDVNGSLTAMQMLSSGGTTSFVLSTPLTVFAGTAPMLAFACDVQPATAIGSTYTISINPASITATNAATGAPVVATGVVGFGPNGLPASLSGSVIVSADAGTGTGTGTGTSTGTPGVPDTGMGGTSALSLLALVLAGLVALVSGMYLRRSLS